MLRFCVLASGSAANTFYVASDSTRVLIDAGLPIADAKARLQAIGESVANIDAILITHGHGDHCNALGAYANRYQLPIYCSEGTRDELMTRPGLKLPTIAEDFREPDWRLIPRDKPVLIGNLVIISFPVPHDALEPTGFYIKSGSHSIAIATDLGWIAGESQYWIERADLVSLESNYDPALLRGAYPNAAQHLRIEEWHMANEQAQAIVREAREEQTFVLGHLSRNSNQYERVRKLHAQDNRVSVAAFGEQSQLFTVGAAQHNGTTARSR